MSAFTVLPGPEFDLTAKASAAGYGNKPWSADDRSPAAPILSYLPEGHLEAREARAAQAAAEAEAFRTARRAAAASVDIFDLEAY